VDSKKALLEWVLWVSLSFGLFVSEIFVPMLSPVVLLFAPMPFMIVEYRLGTRLAMLGALVGTAAFAVTGDYPGSIMFCVMFAFTGMAFGSAAKVADSGADYALMAVTTSVLAKVFIMCIFTFSMGVNPFGITPESAANILKAVSSAAVKWKTAVLPEATMKEAVASVVETVHMLMPSMIILFGAMDSWACYALGGRIVTKLGSKPFPALAPFAVWRVPKNIFWALLMALVLQFASKFMPDVRALTVISDNLMEVLRVVLTVDGLAVCWFFMTKRKIHKAIKFSFAVFCVIFSPISYILCMVGIFDIWYDLRKFARGK
jgi:uncharacterized protein YybS (DUF2232 family)